VNRIFLRVGAGSLEAKEPPMVADIGRVGWSFSRCRTVLVGLSLEGREIADLTSITALSLLTLADLVNPPRLRDMSPLEVAGRSVLNGTMGTLRGPPSLGFGQSGTGFAAATTSTLLAFVPRSSDEVGPVNSVFVDGSTADRDRL
jgi:hypothetical protein